MEVLTPSTPVLVPGAAGLRAEVKGVVRPTFGLTFWLCCAWLLIVVLATAIAQWLPLAAPDAVDPFVRLEPVISKGHVLGTDDLGRDVLSRMVYGARVSLIVGALSVIIGVGVGLPAGLFAGYIRRQLDAVTMFAVDVVLSFPALVLLLALIAYLGRSLFVIGALIGFLAIPAYTRISRASTLAVASRDFVKAARALGLRPTRIITRELLPNVLPAVLAYGLIQMGVAIVVEGSLSFLGLSVSLPTPSWGGLIAVGQHHLDDDPSLAVIPSLAMFVTVFALNFIGDAVSRRGDQRGGLL